MTARASTPLTLRSAIILAVVVLLSLGILLAALLPQSGTGQGYDPTRPAEFPDVIRFGGPGAYKVNQKMWGLLEVARVKGFLDKEFQGTPTKLEFIGFTNVPMVGEALASGGVDFAGQGELIAILSRSTGARTRMILPMSRLENAYLVVPTNSPIRSIEQIRGKRIAYMRGAYIHIQTLRILADHGLSESDIVPVNLDPASSATVLASGGVDGVFLGVHSALPMRNRGVGRIVYDTRSAPTETAQTGLIVRDDFANRYPEATQRVVNALVRAAHWADDPAHRTELFRIWLYGSERSLADTEEDMGPGRLTARVSPLIDPFVVSQYRNTQDFALRAKLLRQPIDIDSWIDGSFLDRALRETRLTGSFPDFDAHGRPAATARAGVPEAGDRS
jgi:sulfonate transport system substrate-binding protein